MRHGMKIFAAAAIALGAAALPVAPAQEQQQNQQQGQQVSRDDMPREVRHQSDVQTRGGSDRQYERRTQDGKTYYAVLFTNQDGERVEIIFDENGRVAQGRRLVSNQAEPGPDAAADDTNMSFDPIAKDQLPKEVRRTLEEHARDGRDQLYQKQIRGDQVRYSVHWTTEDDQRKFVRVDESGDIVRGPELSRQRIGKNPRPERVTGGIGALKREQIKGDELPAPVRQTIEQKMANGRGHAFIREVGNDEVTYVVEYVVGNERTAARIAEDGKIIQGSPLSGAGQQAQAQAPAQPQPQAEAQPQPAAAKQGAEQAVAGPHQVLQNADQLPAEVRRAVEGAAPAGSSDLLMQRFTRNDQVLYSIHFTTPEGRRMFMAVDESGKVVIDPRKSNWQEGGKDVRFEVISGDQLPDQVREQVEKHGGAGHLFIVRNEPGRNALFLVQYTGEKGERMEMHINAEGKLVEEPRRAREQPFTMLDRR